MGLIRNFTAASLALALIAGTATAASAGFWDMFRRNDPEPPPPAPAAAPVQAPHPLIPPSVGGQAAPTLAAPLPAPGALPVQAIPLAPTGQAAAVPIGQVPPDGAVAPGGQAAGDVYARMDRIEGQIRTLTGQLEQLTFELQSLHAQLAEAGVAGVQLPSAGGAPMDAGGVHPGAAPLQALAVNPAPGPIAPTSIGSAIEGQPPAVLGAVPAAPQAAVDMAALGPNQGRYGVAIPTAESLPSAQATQLAALPAGDSLAAYDGAYQSILNGDYATAEQGFRTFLAAYPADGRAADAQFWLGESLYARGLYRDAADAFLTGYNAYPESAKSPDTLLKLGLSLAGLGEQAAACSTYAEALRKYPTASAALVQRLQAEQASARC